jgi:hypothetical protein
MHRLPFQLLIRQRGYSPLDKGRAGGALSPVGATGRLATSESNRAIPPYQSGPYDRMGRGH